MIALGAGAGLLAGMGGAAAKKGGIEKSLNNIAENIGLVANVVLLSVLILTIFFIIWRIKRLFSRAYIKKIKETRNLLPKLKADLIFFKNVTKFSEEEKLGINNSIQETIGKLKSDFDNKVFIKKFGKEFCEKMLKYFDYVASNKINIEDQIRLVSCWVEMF